jgi:hypothetical protein
MKPGCELDALVAEKVMGWCTDTDRGGFLLDFSTSIADAWVVVEKLASTYLFCLENSGSFWVADFGRSADRRAQCTAETAPHAICLAALKAVGYERGEP